MNELTELLRQLEASHFYGSLEVKLRRAGLFYFARVKHSNLPNQTTETTGAHTMTQANLVDRIAQFIERFVFVKDKQIYGLLALWVIQTYFYKEFEYTGYIFAHSAQPGSGKSRLLEVLDFLVANSSGLLYNPTDAILFRTADGKTQLLDEVDSWTNGEFLRGILNAGFHRGSVVQRNQQQEDGKWCPVSFPVYSPRAMAGIGEGILHGTTKHRTFIIPMVRALRTERREKLRSRKVRPEAEILRAEIELWVNQNREQIAKLYDSADAAFPYLSDLCDRTIDIVEPLAAVLEVSYGGMPELDARRVELLEAVNLTRKEGAELLGDHRILRALAMVAGGNDPLVGSASELAFKCALNPSPSEYEIAATLRRHGFQSRSIRLGNSVRHRYELGKDDLTEACNRFGLGPSVLDAPKEIPPLAAFADEP